jgi:hypothetical protein
MIGKRISPILVEIENALWEFEANRAIKPEFPVEALRASAKIFMSVMMDKMWELQEKEGMPMWDRENMAIRCGESLRAFVKTYVDIDTVELYS